MLLDTHRPQCRRFRGERQQRSAAFAAPLFPLAYHVPSPERLPTLISARRRRALSHFPSAVGITLPNAKAMPTFGTGCAPAPRAQTCVAFPTPNVFYQPVADVVSTTQASSRLEALPEPPAPPPRKRAYEFARGALDQSWSWIEDSYQRLKRPRTYDVSVLGKFDPLLALRLPGEESSWWESTSHSGSETGGSGWATAVVKAAGLGLEHCPFSPAPEPEPARPEPEMGLGLDLGLDPADAPASSPPGPGITAPVTSPMTPSRARALEELHYELSRSIQSQRPGAQQTSRQYLKSCHPRALSCPGFRNPRATLST